MSVKQNFAAWLPGVGKQIDIGHADVPEPGAGEILVEVRNQHYQSYNTANTLHLLPGFTALYIITGQLILSQVKAVAVQPAEYKIQHGILPLPLTYPTIIGCQCIPAARHFRDDRVLS
jgi:hypothetical protein